MEDSRGSLLLQLAVRNLRGLGRRRVVLHAPVGALLAIVHRELLLHACDQIRVRELLEQAGVYSSLFVNADGSVSDNCSGPQLVAPDGPALAGAFYVGMPLADVGIRLDGDPELAERFMDIFELPEKIG